MRKEHGRQHCHIAPRGVRQKKNNKSRKKPKTHPLTTAQAYSPHDRIHVTIKQLHELREIVGIRYSLKTKGKRAKESQCKKERKTQRAMDG